MIRYDDAVDAVLGQRRLRILRIENAFSASGPPQMRFAHSMSCHVTD